MTKSWYIFHTNLAEFSKLRERAPDARAIWYDGRSDLLRGFGSLAKADHIWVEAPLVDSVLGQLETLHRKQITSVDPAPLGPMPSGNLCICAGNDTHVAQFQELTRLIDRTQFCVPFSRNEGATRALEQLGVEASTVTSIFPEVDPYWGFLCASDWAPDERFMIHRFRRAGVPTICLQESVIDFQTRRRMQWCDYALIQGTATLKHLDRPVVFLVGNPRYDELRPAPLPSRDHILVNCNFTYGIHEDVRQQWLEAVVEASHRIGIDYLIAQHPRDPANLSAYNTTGSSPRTIHQLIRDSSVLVTRFSSLIHEAVALGRPVIYFNPHGEKMTYDFEPDGETLVTATSQRELQEALDRFRTDARPEPMSSPSFGNYVTRHCGSTDGRASERVATAARFTTRLKDDRRREHLELDQIISLLQMIHGRLRKKRY